MWESLDPRTDVWVPYPEDLIKKFDEAVKNGTESLEFCLGRNTFKIVFSEMMQYNAEGLGRQVRCQPTSSSVPAIDSPMSPEPISSDAPPPTTWEKETAPTDDDCTRDDAAPIREKLLHEALQTFQSFHSEDHGEICRILEESGWDFEQAVPRLLQLQTRLAGERDVSTLKAEFPHFSRALLLEQLSEDFDLTAVRERLAHLASGSQLSRAKSNVGVSRGVELSFSVWGKTECLSVDTPDVAVAHVTLHDFKPSKWDYLALCRPDTPLHQPKQYISYQWCNKAMAKYEDGVAFTPTATAHGDVHVRYIHFDASDQSYRCVATSRVLHMGPVVQIDVAQGTPNLSVSWFHCSGQPLTTTAWAGLYRTGPHASVIAWSRVTIAQVPGTLHGVKFPQHSHGSLATPLPSPTQAGEYFVRLFVSNTQVPVATCATWTVDAPLVLEMAAQGNALVVDYNLQTMAPKGSWVGVWRVDDALALRAARRRWWWLAQSTGRFETVMKHPGLYQARLILSDGTVGVSSAVVDLRFTAAQLDIVGAVHRGLDVEVAPPQDALSTGEQVLGLCLRHLSKDHLLMVASVSRRIRVISELDIYWLEPLMHALGRDQRGTMAFLQQQLAPGHGVIVDDGDNGVDLEGFTAVEAPRAEIGLGSRQVKFVLRDSSRMLGCSRPGCDTLVNVFSGQTENTCRGHPGHLQNICGRERWSCCEKWSKHAPGCRTYMHHALIFSPEAIAAARDNASLRV
mmetsp:Transcript_47142/g.111039  ORF Transcript_47142/g.111039 Transcript_47142/m.111039 type:complete len:738 (+) Transcript_47142:3-2216(+)